MKTYSRKKQEEETEVIVHLNELCRLCLSKEDNLIPIFNDDDPVPLSLRVMACASLLIFEGDGLPNMICQSCHYQLDKCYAFKKKCENSDLKLKRHLKSIQEHKEEIIEDVDENHPPEVLEEEADGEYFGEQITFIEDHEEENEEEPENITLNEETNKEACTLQVVNEDDDDYLPAIADAVKATLAQQPGLDISGNIQLKVDNMPGRPTQVQVSTEDGSVIIMEFLAEDDSNHEEDTEELKVFQCPKCPKAFSRRIQLSRHSSVHQEQKGFTCNVCEKWFPTRSALMRHERIHTGERPFTCDLCPRSFAQKEILARHLMTHTGQKPYVCPQCNKGFTQKEPLRVHMRTHQNPNPGDIQLHRCTLCPKMFCHASGLSRHLVTHTGKTFKCRVCDKSFTDKSSLKRHHKLSEHNS